MTSTKIKRQAALSGSSDEREQQFYEAMQAADIDRLMDCWSSDEEIICTLPSGIRVLGIHAVREAFSSIFEGGPIRVTPRDVIKLSNHAGAVHSVKQHVLIATHDGDMEVFLSATNVYHHSAKGWYLVAHHSSPAITEAAAAQDDITPTVLH